MASLLETLLGAQNPVTQWAGRNSNLLTGLGTSLLSDGMNFAPAQAGSVLDRQAAQQKDADAKLAASTNATKQWLAQNYPDLAQAVDAGLPVSEAWQEAFNRKNAKTSQVDLNATVEGRQQLAQQYGLGGQEAQMYVLTGKLPGGNDTARYGNAPIYARNDAGDYIAIQPGSDGSINNLSAQLPPGYQIDPGALSADRAAGTLFGNQTTQAALDLPTAIDRGTQAIALIDQLMPTVMDPKTGQMVENQGFNEQFGTAFGVPVGQMTGAIPNTPKADFQSNLDQVKAQGFLQGIEQMKGTGAISEAEGSKATDAVINARTSTTKDGFVKNMQIAKDIINAGIERLKRRAAQSRYSVPTAGGGNVTSTGVPWSLE